MASGAGWALDGGAAEEAGVRSVGVEELIWSAAASSSTGLGLGFLAGAAEEAGAADDSGSTAGGGRVVSVRATAGKGWVAGLVAGGGMRPELSRPGRLKVSLNPMTKPASESTLSTTAANMTAGREKESTS